MNKKTVKKGLMPYAFILVFMACVMLFLNILNQKVNVITYDEFTKEIVNDNIEEIVITPRSNANVYEITGTLKNYNEDESFFLKVPLSAPVMTEILNAEKEYGFKVETVSDPSSSTILLFIINVLPMVILVGVAFFFISRQMNSANKSMDFGKSTTSMYPPSTRT